MITACGIWLWYKRLPYLTAFSATCKVVMNDHTACGIWPWYKPLPYLTAFSATCKDFLNDHCMWNVTRVQSPSPGPHTLTAFSAKMYPSRYIA